MEVAITGATGFIGRRLVASLQFLGHEVRILTRRSIPETIPPDVKVFKGNLNSPCQVLEDFVSDVDVLFHLAAELNDEQQMWETNVDGTENLLKAASGQLKRWVQLSSTGVYGAINSSIITDEARLNPENTYELTKAESDNLVEKYSSGSTMEAIFIRPSNVYGPDMTNQSLFQLISIIDRGLFFFVGRPGAIMNYIHVDNVIDALISAGDLNKPVMPTRNQYIVSDHCSIEEWVCIACSELDKPAPRLRLPEMPVRNLAKMASLFPQSPLKPSRIDAITSRTVYKSNNITHDLSWKPRVSIDEGVRELVCTWKTRKVS